jgi:hypothetical protein
VRVQIKMLQDKKGHDVDHKGVTASEPKLYKKDEIHEVSHELAKCFEQEKAAEIIKGEEPKNDQAPEQDEEKSKKNLFGKKMKSGAPENK